MTLIHLAPLSSRTTKGQLLAFLCGTSGIESKRVGKIELHGSTAVFEAPDDWEARLVRTLDGASMNGRRLRAWTSSAAYPSGGAEDHFQRLVRLLELEGQAE